MLGPLPTISNEGALTSKVTMVNIFRHISLKIGYVICSGRAFRYWP
jgi:hypothetical protein